MDTHCFCCLVNVCNIFRKMFFLLFLLISQFHFIYDFVFDLQVELDWTDWAKRVPLVRLVPPKLSFYLMLWAPRRTQCIGTMNTASFSSYIKITAFSLPRSNNWRKDLDLFSPYGCKSHFYSTRYYVQTNSKSTFPVYFSIITIKSGFIFMMAECWNTLKWVWE